MKGQAKNGLSDQYFWQYGNHNAYLIFKFCLFLHFFFFPLLSKKGLMCLRIYSSLDAFTVTSLGLFPFTIILSVQF